MISGIKALNYQLRGARAKSYPPLNLHLGVTLYILESLTMTDENTKKEHWQGMYSKPLGDLPWEIEAPPKDLIEVIGKGLVSGDRVLDVACGTGNYSLYLAKQGLNVTGVDFSETAIEIANSRKEELGLPVEFIVGNVLELTTLLPDEKFDFILDYSTLHHIFPEDVAGYAAQFTSLLKPGGKLLVVCYSEKDETARGETSARGRFGNEMFYRTKEEIEGLYHGLNMVSYKETLLGKRLHHHGHCFVFEAQG